MSSLNSLSCTCHSLRLQKGPIQPAVQEQTPLTASQLPPFRHKHFSWQSSPKKPWGHAETHTEKDYLLVAYIHIQKVNLALWSRSFTYAFHRRSQSIPPGRYKLRSHGRTTPCCHTDTDDDSRDQTYLQDTLREYHRHSLDLESSDL